MTLPSLKKHQTTLPNSRTEKNTKDWFFSKRLRGCTLALWCCSFVFSSGSGEFAQAELAWESPSPTNESSRSTGFSSSASQRDPSVVQAAWEKDDSSFGAEVDPAVHDRSVVVKRSEGDGLPTTDPFEEDNRIAQLPEDPFEEPEDDPLPELPTEKEEEETTEEPAEEPQMEEPTRDPLFEETLEPETLEETPRSEDATESPQFGQPREDEFDMQTPAPQPAGPPQPLQQPFSQQLQEERRETIENCDDEFAKLQQDTIENVNLNIHLEGTPGRDYPFECEVGQGHYEPRQWAEVNYNWKASALCHKPLYFEQAQLERYGHTWGRCLQPMVSGAHFFSTLPILPYKMGLKTPNECIYTLGHYRPGNCTPYMIEAMPFTWRAALYQAGVVTGTAFTIP